MKPSILSLPGPIRTRLHWFRYKYCTLRHNPTPILKIRASPSNVSSYLGRSDEVDHVRNGTYEIPRGQFDRRANVGKIHGGNWDKSTGEFEDLVIYQSMNQVFQEGRDWHVTPFYENAVTKIKQGGKSYGCDSIQEFENQRLTYLENLYESMRTEGYKTQVRV